MCGAWKAIFFFFTLGILKANPQVCATSPGIAFPHPPRGLGFRIPPGIGFTFPHPSSPCMHVRFGCKRVFLLEGTRTFPIDHHATILPPSSSPAPKQQQPATLCVAAVVVADCFDRSVPFVTLLYTHTSAVLPLRAHYNAHRSR